MPVAEFDGHRLTRPQLHTRHQPPALYLQRNRSTIGPEGGSADESPTERFHRHPRKRRRISADRCARPHPHRACRREQEHQRSCEQPSTSRSSAPAATHTRRGRQQRRRPRTNRHRISIRAGIRAGSGTNSSPCSTRSRVPEISFLRRTSVRCSATSAHGPRSTCLRAAQREAGEVAERLALDPATAKVLKPCQAVLEQQPGAHKISLDQTRGADPDC